jgi:mycothiol synthase
LLIISLAVVVLALLFALFLLYLPVGYLRFRVRWPLRMRRRLSDLPPMVVPNGYALRTYRSGEDGVWVQLVNAAFATETRVSRPVRRVPRVRAGRGQILVAERADGGEVVGTVKVLYAPPGKGRRAGLIFYLAVHPAHRGYGLGAALVLAALLDLQERGHTEAELYTNPALTTAVRLYERLGFTVVRRSGLKWPLRKPGERGASTG